MPVKSELHMMWIEPLYDHVLMDNNDTSNSPTGHSRALRDRLRAAREERGMTQKDVARLISERMGDGRTWSSSAVSEWERFTRHPPIDAMAIWARVVGLRLIVDLDDVKSSRVPVLLHAHTAEVARAIDSAPDRKRAVIVNLVNEMLGDRTRE